MKVCLVILAVVLMSFTTMLSAQQPRGFQPQPQGSDGPWNHRVILATSSDGKTWTLAGESLAEQASVPELFVGPKGRPILLFVDASGRASRGALGVMEQQEGGSWLRKDTNLRGADPNVVTLDDGTYRAYCKGRDGEFNAYSSEDGFLWLKIGEVFRDDRYPNATDSDVFQTPAGWVMLISIGPRMVRCTSADGLRFTADQVLDLGGSVSDTVKVQGGWRTFFHVNPRPETGNKMIIRSAFTADGKTWTPEGDRLKAPEDGPAKLGLGDPAPIQLQDGSWLMAVKSFMQPAARPAARRSPGQPAPPDNFNPNPPPGNQNAEGPWNRDVILYRVASDGDVEKAATFERAGVPTIARMKDGRLIVAHQHFPADDPEAFDKVAVRISADEGKTWAAPRVISVAGLPEGMRFPFDPTLVPLPDGRIRLYFTGNMGRTFGPSVPAIHSAISADGVHYTYEPGVRFGVEGRMVIDCAVVLHQGEFHLYAPDNGTFPQQPGRRPAEQPEADRPRQGVGYHATSSDGLNFTRVDDVKIDGRRQWLGNAQSDGKLVTFYGTGEGLNAGASQRPRGGFWIATSADGREWTQIANPPIGGGDPGALATLEGGLLVVITGESRNRNAAHNPDRPPSSR